VVDRLVRSHQVIQDNILNPGLIMIPYRRGSREYSPEEHLSVVDEHINYHLRDVQKITGR
jgi:hypothetical protein